jgi:uncharacterized protein YjbI with pentapeptide repeats
MPNPEHLKILKQGVDAWNKWMNENYDIKPDLIKANLREANLREANLLGAKLCKAKINRADLRRAKLDRADLSGANLREANLLGAKLCKAKINRADLRRAKLDGADLREAFLCGANLYKADLVEADLRSADFSWANLAEADFRYADLSKAVLAKTNLVRTNLSRARLSGAYLNEANLVQTQLEGANISNCRIYGISAWNLVISPETKQSNLVITQYDEPVITVDNIEVAQFIYLLLNNAKIRDVIDTIGKKAVLILGRFSKERKYILDSIRDGLRARDYLPILFDFEKPTSKDLTETISTLAHMARFIIADITEPKSIPHELATIVPTLSVPVQPLLLEGSTGEYAMFDDLRKYDWVLSTYHYENLDDLHKSFGDKLVFPAEEKAKELIARKQ